MGPVKTPDTTYDLVKSLTDGVTEKENQAKANDLRLYKQEGIRTSISPLYARYIGTTVTIAFNGNFRKFPVDGSEFVCSRGHYNALMKYIRSIDRQIKISQNNAKFMDANATGDFKKIV